MTEALEIDSGWVPDEKTIQWVVERIDGMVAERVSKRRGKRPLVSDETIAATARWILRENERSIEAVKLPADLLDRCNAITGANHHHGTIETLMRDIAARTAPLGYKRIELTRVLADQTMWGLPTTISIFFDVTERGMTIEQWVEANHGG